MGGSALLRGKERVDVEMDPGMVRDLRELADENERSLSAEIRIACRRHIKREWDARTDG